MKFKKVLENKENKSETLRSGKVGEFWRVIGEAIDDSIDYLKDIQDSDDIVNLPAEEYKIHNEILKAKIVNLKRLKELPDTLIAYMQEPEQQEQNFDPYITREEMLKKMRKGEVI